MTGNGVQPFILHFLPVLLNTAKPVGDILYPSSMISVLSSDPQRNCRRTSHKKTFSITHFFILIN